MIQLEDDLKGLNLTGNVRIYVAPKTILFSFFGKHSFYFYFPQSIVFAEVFGHIRCNLNDVSGVNTYSMAIALVLRCVIC